MKEFADVVYEILNAETHAAVPPGDAGSLFGLKILRDEHESLTTANCGITWGTETAISMAGPIRHVQGTLPLFISIEVSKKAATHTGLEWYNARSLAETWARKVEKVIGANPKLVATGYSSGFTRFPQNTHISLLDFAYQIINAANMAVCRMDLTAQYTYHNGVISINV